MTGGEPLRFCNSWTSDKYTPLYDSFSHWAINQLIVNREYHLMLQDDVLNMADKMIINKNGGLKRFYSVHYIIKAINLLYFLIVLQVGL